jgi:HlyD family secretion protein
MQDKESEKIELRSDEVQEILGMVPSWIVRWGTVVILLTVLAILAGSYFFSYPDIVRADIVVTTENPPSTLEARTDGPIELFVKDSQFVETGKHLAMIRYAAEYDDYLELKYEIELLRTLIPDFNKEEFMVLDEDYRIGDIQQAYTGFIQAYQDYYDFLVTDIYTQQIRSTVNQIQGRRKFLSELEEQRKILQKRLDNANSRFERISKSYAEGVVTEIEYEDTQNEVYEIENRIADSRLNIISTENEIIELQQDTAQYRLDEWQEKQDKQSNLRAAFENLEAAILSWEQQYLLIALTDGVVSFTGTWAENQNVNSGERVLTVVPENPGEIIGKIGLPVEGAGKVEIGDAVNIKFDNFPYLEFGMVGGRIRSISQVPDDQLYSVDVELTDGLVTFYGDTITFNQEMPGIAEIITDDRKLLERITSPIRSVLTEQREPRTLPEQD